MFSHVILGASLMTFKHLKLIICLGQEFLCIQPIFLLCFQFKWLLQVSIFAGYPLDQPSDPELSETSYVNFMYADQQFTMGRHGTHMWVAGGFMDKFSDSDW